MSSRISDQWKAWINDALPKMAPNDRARWEIIPTVNEQGFAFGLLVVIPSPVMGEYLQTLLMITSPQKATKEKVVAFLQSMIDRLHAQRSELISKQLPQNGGDPPASPGSGLILPR